MQKPTFALVVAVLALVASGIVALADWAQSAAGIAAAAPTELRQSSPASQAVAVQQTGVTVTGEGIVTVKPDQAKITLGVEVTSDTANGAQQDAAAKMDAVVAELKKQGIQEKDIQTVRADLSPEYDHSDRTPVLKGYRATNLVVVTVRDIAKLGDLLDAVVASGATRIQGIRFSVSDPAAAGAQGREEAMKNARAKADQLARLAGVSLGQPLSIQETSSAPPAPVEMMDAMAAPAAKVARTPISPGMQEIRTTVQVTYSIR